MLQASLKRIPSLGATIKAASPLGRAAGLDEVADYIVFLCSPSASYINGTGLVIDAGLTLTVRTYGKRLYILTKLFHIVIIRLKFLVVE